MQHQSSHNSSTDMEAATLRQLIMSFRTTQLIHAAARLDLADRLQTPQTPEQLAGTAGINADAVGRILRALASLGIFTERPDGCFALTPLARLLRSDTPGSLRGVALLFGEDWLWQAYGRLLHSVQTGQPAFQEVHGQSFYNFLGSHPAAAARFQAPMGSLSGEESSAILAAYDFGSIRSVVDVGGGNGALLAAILQGHQRLSGTVFDLAPAIEAAHRFLAAAGLAGRAEAVVGDFFASVPPGGDLYLLKRILHNWNDEDASRILRSCRRAMPAGARLLAIELIVPGGNDPSEAKLYDINMLVVVGGRERTEAEYRQLFATAGFTLTRIVPTAAALSLIEAAPAG